MAAPSWLNQASHFSIAHISPDRNQQLLTYLINVSNTDHLWCQHDVEIRLLIPTLVGGTGRGKALLQTAQSTLASCKQCVEKYLIVHEWLKYQYETPNHAALQQKLDELDFARILSHFASLPALPAHPFTTKTVLALLEIMSRPHLLELDSNPTFEHAKETFYQYLIAWYPPNSNPKIDQNQIAYGIMCMFESKHPEVVTWAKKFTWRSFVPKEFVDPFDALLRHYELLASATEPLVSSEFYRPPEGQFSVAMCSLFRHLQRVPEVGKIFSQLDILPRISKLFEFGFLTPQHGCQVMTALLENGPIIFRTVSDPVRLVDSLLAATALPCLMTHRSSVFAISDAANMIRALVASIKKLQLNDFLLVTSRVSPPLAQAFTHNKDSSAIQSCIKEIAFVSFSRKPAVTMPLELKPLWTSCVDKASDIRLLRAAMMAEADYMRRSILAEVHRRHSDTKYSIWPQRMIISGIVHENHCISFLLMLLVKCCSLAILDCQSTRSGLLEKQVKITGEILDNVSTLMHVSASQLAGLQDVVHFDTVISVALYWLCSSKHEAFEKFLLRMFSIFPAAQSYSIERILTIDNAHITLRTLKALLWDLTIYGFIPCLSACTLIADWTCRILKSEYISNVLTGGAGVTEDDKETANEVVRLAWLFAKFLLCPLPTEQDTKQDPTRPPRQEKRYVPSEDAVAPALRIIIALLQHHSQTSIVKRALEDDNVVENWLSTLILLPTFMSTPSDTAIISWKSLLAVIRKSLIRRSFYPSEKFKQHLIRVARHFQLEEWNLLFARPFVPSTQNSSGALASTPPSTHQRQLDTNSSMYPAGSSHNLTPRSPPGNTHQSRGTLFPSSHPATNGIAHTLPKKVAKPTVARQVVPVGPSVQERKEMDAELQRQQAAKRKRNDADSSEETGVLVVADIRKMKGSRSLFDTTEHQARAEFHSQARVLRVKSLDDLYDLVMSLSFATLKFPAQLCEGAISVPNTFRSADEYVQTFEPLLLLELQAQLQSSKEDATLGTNFQTEQVVTRKITYLSTIGHSHDLTIRKEHNWHGCLVFLMWPKGRDDPKVEFTRLLRDASLMPHCLAVVTKEQKRKSKVPTLETMAGATDEMSIVLRVNLDGAKDHRSGLFSKLTIGSEWNFVPFFSLSTACREWQALQTIGTLNCVSEILSPALFGIPPASRYNVDQLRQLASKLNEERHYNTSQRSAITRALATKGFSFIQGPPGTGKTRTLIGLISILYALQGAPLLICTPSNAAIDEIVDRIIRGGLYDMTKSAANATTTSFKVVRVGNHADMSESVRRVSLSELVRNTPGSNSATAREQIETSVLKSADIVCTTLSTSGAGSLVRANIPFRTVIVDEAAQAVELATLIPLQHQCDQCILIGDPQQLPATVFSQVASQYRYERSLFARFAEAANSPSDRIMLLNTQYRMHPYISSFPNQYFYQGKLLDGVKDTPSSWSIVNPLFSPVRFYDILHSTNTPGKKSLHNPEEIVFIVTLIYKLAQSSPSTFFGDKIVVITPYQLQRQLIQSEFNRQQNNLALFGQIEVCTVDSFQGREKSIVILSTVRAKKGQSIGFLADIRRMNVALTRAKHSLWIVGHSETLQINPVWKALINSVKDRQMFTVVDKPSQEWWNEKV